MMITRRSVLSKRVDFERLLSDLLRRVKVRIARLPETHYSHVAVCANLFRTHETAIPCHVGSKNGCEAAGSGRSGIPARRRPSTYFAKSCGRRSGNKVRTCAMRKLGDAKSLDVAKGNKASVKQ